MDETSLASESASPSRASPLPAAAARRGGVGGGGVTWAAAVRANASQGAVFPAGPVAAPAANAVEVDDTEDPYAPSPTALGRPESRPPLPAARVLCVLVALNFCPCELHGTL